MDFKQRLVGGETIKFKGTNKRMIVDFKGNYFRVWIDKRIVCLARTYENMFREKLVELIERYELKEVK